MLDGHDHHPPLPDHQCHHHHHHHHRSEKIIKTSTVGGSVLSLSSILSSRTTGKVVAMMAMLVSVSVMVMMMAMLVSAMVMMIYTHDVQYHHIHHMTCATHLT